MLHKIKHPFMRFVGVSLILVLVTPLGVVFWNYLMLPTVTELGETEFTEPLKIFTRDGELISEIGEIKRTPIEFHQVPQQLQLAFLAAEDARFYDHSGIDFLSLARAVSQYLRNDAQQTGASTITMQLARGFYLTNERTLWRKFREILLAIKIELALPKDKIFELYLNKIFLGHKSYGIAAAAKTYFNSEIRDLSLAQAASIAALPKAPSTLNPITSAQRNKQRRDWILGRMLELEYIDEILYQQAVDEPIQATPYQVRTDVAAGYVAETVRIRLLEPGFLSTQGIDTHYLYNQGLKVYTTIDSTLQRAGNLSSFANLLAYEQRHGYKKTTNYHAIFELSQSVVSGGNNNIPLTFMELPHQAQLQNIEGFDAVLDAMLATPNYSDRLLPALVYRVTVDSMSIFVIDGKHHELRFPNDFPFVGKYQSLNAYESVDSFSSLFRPGDQIYVHEASLLLTPDKDNPPGQWVIGQAPSAQTALVSIDPSDGEVLAMVGGADYSLSQFNRTSQAERLIGSNIKPLIYAWGIENGLAPGSVFVDGPIINNENWRPQNAGLSFLGPITLRQALYQSRNLVSIRMLEYLGVNAVADFIEKLRLSQTPPRDLSLALGTSDFSPINTARANAMFANGGYLVDTFLIDSVYDKHNNQMYSRQAQGVCMRQIVDAYDMPNLAQSVVTTQAEHLLPELFTKKWRNFYCSDEQVSPSRQFSKDTSFMVFNMMQDTISLGTARQARMLKRSDFGGKTGTTDDNIDAWFTSVHPMITTTIWVGFDSPGSLGRYEGGSRAALPGWINYMQRIKHAIPQVHLTRPESVVDAYIDPTNGEQVPANFPNAKLELFTEDSLPPFSRKILLQRQPSRLVTGATTVGTTTDIPEESELEVLQRPEDIF